MPDKPIQTLSIIAEMNLGIKTLATQNSDRLDFHEVSVWCVKKALERAYQVGFEACVKTQST